MKKYILQGHKAVLVDRETYLNQPEHQDRTVAKSTIGDYLVSTVFLGLDHQWHAHGPPLLFETMVFGKGPLDERLERCTTWEEAEAMHETMCEEVRQQKSKPGESMKHTPGPWLFCDNSGLNRNIWGDTTLIARVDGNEVDCDTADANARLIAAAPDLLQALERAVALIAWELKHDVTNEWPNASGVKQEIEKAARAAIAKATNLKE